MSNFKPTSLATLPSIIEPLSESAKYWQTCLQPSKVAKELSAINCIDMNAMHDILVTSSTRLAIYEYYSMEVKRSLTTSHYVPLFGANYRKSDSKLIVSGAGDGVIRIWDTKSSKPLRALGLSDKNKSLRHSAAARRTHFTSNSRVVSFGDDYDIKLWDITEETVVSTFGDHKAHKDYIRASFVCPNSSTVISGSYDNTVKVWDERSPQKASAEIDHGSPVESVTVRNLVAISAGGDTVKVFDLVAGKVFKTLFKTHHKTITCVHNYGNYLLTASIDGHLKVYDSNFNIAASMSYTPSQLLYCSLDDKVLAVGANDGLFSVNKFKSNSKDMNSFENKNVPKNRYLSETNELFGDRKASKRKHSLDLEQTLVVKDRKKKNRFLSKHDDLLRKFNHSAALTSVFRNVSADPEAKVSFMQELIRRGALKAALAGRTDKELAPIIDLLVTHLKDPRFNRILVDVALILSDVYMSEINRSDKMQSMFMRLNCSVNSEMDLMQQMLSVCGQLSTIVNSSVN